MKPANPFPCSLAILSALLLLASTCAARGGPAAPPEPAKSANTTITPKSGAPSAAATTTAATSTGSSQLASIVDDDKDINPFTGQSLSEAQLRRTLEREKLITAISSEKTKQTQSNSELQMARLRNAAERSRLSSEVIVLSPANVPLSAPHAGARKNNSGMPPTKPSNTALQAPFKPLAPIVATTVQDAALNNPSPNRSSRAEIRFHDEIIELRGSATSAPSVIASVDAQRHPQTDSAQPRPITAINVTPATLPPLAPPSFSTMVPSTQAP